VKIDVELLFVFIHYFHPFNEKIVVKHLFAFIHLEKQNQK